MTFAILVLVVAALVIGRGLFAGCAAAVAIMVGFVVLAVLAVAVGVR